MKKCMYGIVEHFSKHLVETSHQSKIWTHTEITVSKIEGDF